MNIKRCQWATTHPLNEIYHDTEWGRPCYDDDTLFEFLILEGMQAGLSWLTILKKRESFHKAFDGFNAEKMARYSAKKEAKLLENADIIRNKLKIKSTIRNAQVYLDILETEGSFKDYVWKFVDGQPIINNWKKDSDMPAKTELSDKMSKELKKRGFNFVGSTICYSFMQATGMINDHITSCFCRTDLRSSNVIPTSAEGSHELL